jgi:type IV pilus assembly protein PilC
MPSYRYVGRDVFNRTRRGIVEADDVESAKELLLKQGLVVIEKLKEDKPLFSTEITLSLIHISEPTRPY